MSPDDVCGAYSDRGVAIRLAVVSGGEPGSASAPESFVLVEGTADSLRFLGELLIAHAAAGDCHFWLHPAGPGSAFFRSETAHGISIHRIPCDSVHP